jgi:hypothetical protein
MIMALNPAYPVNGRVVAMGWYVPNNMKIGAFLSL